MASAAAATAASRARRSPAPRSDKLRAHRALSERRRRLKAATGDAFDALSADGKWIVDSQMEELLSVSLGNGDKKLQSDAVQLVIDTARRAQERAGTTPPSREAVAREFVVRAVGQFGEYAQNAERIDGEFRKYDRDGNGHLSRGELMKLLTSYERKQRRSRSGWVRTLVVAWEDVDWIIDEAGSDQTGTINQAEYLAAIAAWEEVARMKLENPEKCAIM